MTKSDEYQESYSQIDKGMDTKLEDVISSLRFLVEDMIDTLTDLEEVISKEYQVKKLKLEASARTGIKIND